MRGLAPVIAAIVCFGVIGCDKREPRVVGSRPSPDGTKTLWVANEYGGLASGVVHVYVTRQGEVPGAQSDVLRTPECSNAIVGWVDSSTVAVIYDSLSLTGFSSGSTRHGLRTLLVDRRTPGVSEVHLSAAIALPCDPY